MPLIELTSYRLALMGTGSGLSEGDLALEPGELAAVQADRPEDAHLLLRALATLVRPISGSFRFADRQLDFSDYRNLLPVKRRIGYVAADAAMLSNRTLRQNILTFRYYFENSLSLRLDPETRTLCRLLGIEEELDRLPSEVAPVDLYRAIAVREISKAPDLLLFDRPEETIGAAAFHLLLRETVGRQPARSAWICSTSDPYFLKEFCNRRIRIRNGVMEEDSPGEKINTGQ